MMRGRLFIVIAALLVSAALRAGPVQETVPADDLNGEWTNENGRKITLKVEGDQVTVTGGGTWSGTYDAASGAIKIERDATPDDIRAKPGQPEPPDWAKRDLAKLIGKIRAEFKVSIEPGSYYTLSLSGTRFVPNADFKEQGDEHKVWREEGDTRVKMSYRRVVRTI
jgi:hypothetical protein